MASKSLKSDGEIDLALAVHEYPQVGDLVSHQFDFGLGVVRPDAEQNDQACSKLSDDVAFDCNFTLCDTFQNCAHSYCA